MTDHATQRAKRYRAFGLTHEDVSGRIHNVSTQTSVAVHLASSPRFLSVDGAEGKHCWGIVRAGLSDGAPQLVTVLICGAGPDKPDAMLATKLRVDRIVR